MIRIYADAYGSSILVSVILKLVADVLNIVGPLVVGAVTAYVVTISYPQDTEQVALDIMCFIKLRLNTI